MALETYKSADQLYQARAEEINALRPLFSGDVLADVGIPGVQDGGMAMIVAHPCAMRGKNAQLKVRILAAAVRPHEQVGRGAWTRGYSDRVPLPDLVEEGSFHVAQLDDVGKVRRDELDVAARLACLSEFGINLLQQRFVWHLTRLEVPTFSFHEAFAHTFEEADLLEDWNETVCGAGLSPPDAAKRFEAFLRADQGQGRTLQDDLRDPQRRSAVRSRCRVEARRIATELLSPGG